MADSSTSDSVRLLTSPKQFYKQQINEIVQSANSYVDYKTLADEHERLKLEAIDMLDRTRRLIGLLFWKKYRKRLEAELEIEYEHVKEINKVKEHEYRRREKMEKVNQLERQKLEQLEQELNATRTNYAKEVQKSQEEEIERYKKLLNDIGQNSEVVPLVSNYIIQSKMSKLSKGFLACTVGAPIDGFTGFTKSAATSVLKLLKTLD
uniref:Uncharacterized protein n=1 Tax=Syphacia muris TaxID=451379 RepID=A0A0N5APN1_9BILA